MGRSPKSRTMFLMTLRAGFQDYAINASALIYLYEQDAPEFLIDRLMSAEGRVFADEDDWTDHLIAIGITGVKSVRLATAAAKAVARLTDIIRRRAAPAPA